MSVSEELREGMGKLDDDWSPRAVTERERDAMAAVDAEYEREMRKRAERAARSDPGYTAKQPGWRPLHELARCVLDMLQGQYQRETKLHEEAEMLKMQLEKVQAGISEEAATGQQLCRQWAELPEVVRETFTAVEDSAADRLQGWCLETGRMPKKPGTLTVDYPRNPTAEAGWQTEGAMNWPYQKT